MAETPHPSEILFRIHKNRLTQVRGSLVVFHGKPFLDVRLWTRKGADSEPVPVKRKGLCLSLRHWQAVKKQVEKALARKDLDQLVQQLREQAVENTAPSDGDWLSRCIITLL